MSQFVSQENQSLLWKLLNRSPSFGNQPEAMKNEIFRTMISRQYDTLGAPSAPMDYKSLQQTNKETIRMILNVFQQIPDRTSSSSASAPTSSSTSTQIRPGYGPGIEPQLNMLYKDHTGTVLPDPIDDTQNVFLMQNQTSREFSQLQQEYEQMGAKPSAPDTSVFRENEYQADEAIQNLDELLLQYQNERENDLLPIAPPPEEPKAPMVEEESPAKATSSTPLHISTSVSTSVSTVSLEERIQTLEARVQSLELFIQEFRDTSVIPPTYDQSDIETPEEITQDTYVEDNTPVRFVRISPEDGHELEDYEEEL
jgi:hypothetical protein